MQISSKEVTKAIARYAKQHGYYARTVRAVSALKQKAIAEYWRAWCEGLSGQQRWIFSLGWTHGRNTGSGSRKTAIAQLTARMSISPSAEEAELFCAGAEDGAQRDSWRLDRMFARKRAEA